MLDIVKTITREIAKVLMFGLLWAFPLWLLKETGNGYYLFFFALSFFGTFAVFGHYEGLERIDEYVELLEEERNQDEED